jgi:hypothetical protein
MYILKEVQKQLLNASCSMMPFHSINDSAFGCTLGFPMIFKTQENAQLLRDNTSYTTKYGAPTHK